MGGACGVTAFTDPEVYFNTGSYTVYAKRDVVAGYSHTVCLTCTNGYQTAQVDNWKIS